MKIDFKPDFNSIKKLSSEGVEYWEARELRKMFGYNTWESFNNVIKKAIISMSQVYPQINHHFREVTKMIKIGSGTGKEATRPIVDYKLSRYACYLIAQNGDSTKSPIAEAQNYFAIQTRKQEIKEEHDKAIERIMAREKFSGVLNEHGVDSKGIGEIRSDGDEALFDMTTNELKGKYGIKSNKPLADHLPTIAIKAKDLAAEMTTFNTDSKNLRGTRTIKYEHITNNHDIRQMLSSHGIHLKALPAEEDIVKLMKKIPLEELETIAVKDFKDISELIINVIDIENAAELEKVALIIKTNPGDTDLKIIYGNENAPKLLIRKIQINNKVIQGLKKYIML